MASKYMKNLQEELRRQRLAELNSKPLPTKLKEYAEKSDLAAIQDSLNNTKDELEKRIEKVISGFPKSINFPVQKSLSIPVAIDEGGTGATTLAQAQTNLGIGSSMVYPDAGIALSTGAAWDTSITNNSSNWNTAYGWGDHSAIGYLKADGSIALSALWEAGKSIFTPLISGVAKLGFFIGDSTTPNSVFQTYDSGALTYTMISSEKYQDGGGWHDMGNTRVGGTLQIIGDGLNFLAWNTAATSTTPFSIAQTTGNVSVLNKLSVGSSFELGHASDTTIARVSAGVVSIEGVNILTVAGGTLTGNLTLGENTSIALDPAGSADGKYSGTTVTGTGGDTIAFGDLVTLDKDDSRWEKVDISVAAAATGDARGIIGIAVTSSTDGNPITVLLHGIIRADANFPALTIGAPVYASTTGDVVVAQPTTTDYVIRIVGYGLTADEMYFNPGNSWTTHT